jgi:hypothetical protein
VVTNKYQGRSTCLLELGYKIRELCPGSDWKLVSFGGRPGLSHVPVITHFEFCTSKSFLNANGLFAFVTFYRLFKSNQTSIICQVPRYPDSTSTELLCWTSVIVL